MTHFGLLVTSSVMLLPCEAIPSNSAITSASVSKSQKYLISSFPNIKSVAYVHIPDTVWRPLFLGTVSNPTSVVADPLNARLFVGDTDLKKIFWYNLIIEGDGLLKTDGQQHIAVDGVEPNWMAVNGLGDLYFTGTMIVKSPETSSRSVYRMDVGKIQAGDALDPVEVYSKSNSGFPDPAVWLPSGVAVNSFNIFWGNEERGSQHGSVCSGTRQDTKALVTQVDVLSKANNEVRGMAYTGTSVFYLTPQGVYGLTPSGNAPIDTNAATGLIQPMADGWNPVSIAFDDEDTLYWTETAAGIIYTLPAGDTNPSPIQKYTDAPQVYGVTIFAASGETRKQTNNEAKLYGQPQSSAKAVESSALQMRFSAGLLFLIMALKAW